MRKKAQHTPWDDALLHSLNVAQAKLKIAEEQTTKWARLCGELHQSSHADARRIASLEKETERLKALLDKQIY
jgi:signal transduction histidine kinase